MNQILGNQELEDFFIEEKKLDIKHFKYIFLISIFLIIFLFVFIIYNFFEIKKNKTASNRIQFNYNTLKLYSTYSPQDVFSNLTINNFYEENTIIGEIEIPSLNILYPIFSKLDDKNLKISPCIFSGKMPPANSNLCIAGHNYNNDQFFSRISKLKKEDKIYIYDENHNKYIYSVFANYEVKTDDLSPIFLNFSNELTLITCNNLNNNRIIIKAKY